MDIIDPNNYHPLGKGTADERAIPHLKSSNLGTDYDQIFGALLQIHQAASDQRGGGVQRIVIQAIWMLWCYTSIDIAALNAAVDELDTDEHSDAMSKLLDKVAALTTEVADLRAEVTKLRESK